MAYNNREWDRGKSNNWDDGGGGGWYDHSGGGRGNVRGREEDYHGEGKRRKYNNGGYDASQNWDEGSYDTNYYDTSYHDTSYHEQQDVRPSRGGYGGGSSGGAGRGGGGFHAQAKKPLVPSEPSAHVIFLGLDPDFTEADLQAYLAGQSKGFGFAQFTTVEHARAFVDPLFPFIQVPPPASHGASATAAFHKALEMGTPHNGRRVKIDYSQSANPGDKNRFGRPTHSNDGTRDIGNSQAPVLLFRGLDSLSGPQAIAQAMKTSSGLHTEGAKGMKRIILIKDKVTMASWGFAFVEFVDVQAASAVLAAMMSPQIHPNGFRISDRPVAASFAHMYSFQPLSDPMQRDAASIPSSLALGGVEGTWVKYWDEASTIAMLEFKVEEPVQQPTATGAVKKERKRKAVDDHAVERPAPVEASALPVSDKPVTLSFKGGLASSKGVASTAPKPAAPLTLGFSMTDETATNDDESAEKTSATDDAKVAAAKKVPPMIASKKTASNINKWNQVQEELGAGVSAAGPSTSTASATPVKQGTPAKSVTPEVKAKSSTPLPPETEFEFSDMVKFTCLLCARQFKSLDQLKRHNKESDLHKARTCSRLAHKNYRDANLRDLAREKASAAKVAAASSSSAPAQPKYRDRAS
ncbi:hypothetical protein EW146_g5981, partial [Bondarzewia mesenterica]